METLGKIEVNALELHQAATRVIQTTGQSVLARSWITKSVNAAVHTNCKVTLNQDDPALVVILAMRAEEEREKQNIMDRFKGII